VVDRLVLERLFSLINGYLNDLKSVKDVTFAEHAKDVKNPSHCDRGMS